MTARNDTISDLPALRPGAPSHDGPGAARPDPRVAAQLAGAAGVRRGLRGGAPVLQAARSAYLQAQWSGPDDRRGAAGQVKAARI